jgi:hypothetical protein
LLEERRREEREGCHRRAMMGKGTTKGKEEKKKN